MPNDGDFAFNGILRADRVPNPAFYEVAKQYQRVDFKLHGERLILKNNYMFTNLNRYGLLVNKFVNGQLTKQLYFDIPSCLPGEEVKFELPNLVEQDETAIDLLVVTLEDEGVYKQGDVLAHEQFIVNEVLPVVKFNGNEAPAINEIGDFFMIGGEGFTMKINKKTGGLDSMIMGTELLNSPIMPNFARAITDNDEFKTVPFKWVRGFLGAYSFMRANKHLKATSVKATTEGQFAVITIKWMMPLASGIESVYKINSVGEIEANLKITPLFRPLPRFGFTVELSRVADQMKFYAKGPHENYCDRCSGSYLAQYEGKVDEFLHDYLFPQENGNHTGARWLQVGDDQMGIKVEAIDKPFEFSVHPYTMEALQKAQHLHELEKTDNFTVNIDGKQAGVSGDTPAFRTTMKKYMLRPFKKQEFKCKIKFICE